MSIQPRPTRATACMVGGSGNWRMSPSSSQTQTRARTRHVRRCGEGFAAKGFGTDPATGGGGGRASATARMPGASAAGTTRGPVILMSTSRTETSVWPSMADLDHLAVRRRRCAAGTAAFARNTHDLSHFVVCKEKAVDLIFDEFQVSCSARGFQIHSNASGFLSRNSASAIGIRAKSHSHFSR